MAASLSCLNLVVEHKREKGIPGLMDTTVNQRLGPKELAESESFFISLKKMMPISALLESLKQKRQAQNLAISCVLQHKC